MFKKSAVLMVVLSVISTTFGTVLYHEDFDQVMAAGSWDVTQYVYGPSGSGSLGVYDAPNWGYPPGFTSFPDGAIYGAYFNMFAANDQALFINKNTLGNYQANTAYTLTVYVGQRADGYAGADWRLSLTKGDVVTNGAQYPSLISLGTPVASATNFNSGALVPGIWKLVTATKTIGASDPLIGTPIGVEMFVNYNSNIGGALQQFSIDGITLDAIAIPEPITLVVLGLGSLLIRKRMW